MNEFQNALIERLDKLIEVIERNTDALIDVAVLSDDEEREEERREM